MSNFSDLITPTGVLTATNTQTVTNKTINLANNTVTGTASININGTVGATTPAAGTFTSLTDSGNLTFTGTGNRITGNMTSGLVGGTPLALQTSTANSLTQVYVIPNGTSTNSYLMLASGTSANENFLQVGLNNAGSQASLNSGILGTGTYLPMTFYTGGLERVRFDTSGNVGIGKTPVAGRGVLQVNGDVEMTSQNTGQLAGLRNKIINGNMDVWQRGTSFTLNNSAAYTSDRMSFQSSGTGNVTVARTAVTAGSQASMNTSANYTMGVTGVAGLNYYLLAQYVEGVSTFQAKTITCSIYCDQPAPSGSYFRTVQVFGTGGSTAVTTDVVLTSTAVGSHYRWTATIAVPSISGKTIGTANDCLAVALVLVPSNFTVTYQFYGLQAELGSVATPFEQRPYGMELALCQRYLPARSTSGTSITMGFGAWAVSTQAVVILNWPVSTRVPVTGITTTAASGFNCQLPGVSNNTPTSITFNSATTESLVVNVITTTGGSGGQSAALLGASGVQTIFGTGCEL